MPFNGAKTMGTNAKSTLENKGGRSARVTECRGNASQLRPATGQRSTWKISMSGWTWPTGFWASTKMTLQRCLASSLSGSSQF